jgi:hypothetical protein
MDEMPIKAGCASHVTMHAGYFWDGGLDGYCGKCDVTALLC